ncbi:MAG TPA: EF-P lysine aminoacylase EpmA [Steroidobacteraceae bacterium]|nr:EF-P lysine aminoacylase EpmA [Steroidobacteraceae bacterium]
MIDAGLRVSDISSIAHAWRPTATPAALRKRAGALRFTREFFHERGVLEVETPAMVNAAVSDVNLGSVRAQVAGFDAPLFLHTSPEYAMKRLLAAGSGDIYQVCHVYRGAERGRQHNPEFTMLEWYRLGFSLQDLMAEVAALVRGLLGVDLPVEMVAYRDAVLRHSGLDPLDATDAALRDAAMRLGMSVDHAHGAGRDELLDLIVGAQVGPALGANSLTFVHRYPASQAALARLDPADARLALRFELYRSGIELANGYHELSDVAEQRRRFDADQEARRARGLPVNSLDPHLLAALESGLPDCAGVALGFDRVLMLAMNAASIDDVLAFPVERA